jgi:hypothetical protein
VLNVHCTRACRGVSSYCCRASKVLCEKQAVNVRLTAMWVEQCLSARTDRHCTICRVMEALWKWRQRANPNLVRITVY